MSIGQQHTEGVVTGRSHHQLDVGSSIADAAVGGFALEHLLQTGIGVKLAATHLNRVGQCGVFVLEGSFGNNFFHIGNSEGGIGLEPKRDSTGHMRRSHRCAHTPAEAVLAAVVGNLRRKAAGIGGIVIVVNRRDNYSAGSHYQRHVSAVDKSAVRRVVGNLAHREVVG